MRNPFKRNKPITFHLHNITKKGDIYEAEMDEELFDKIHSGFNIVHDCDTGEVFCPLNILFSVIKVKRGVKKDD